MANKLKSLKNTDQIYRSLNRFSVECALKFKKDVEQRFKDNEVVKVSGFNDLGVVFELIDDLEHLDYFVGIYERTVANVQAAKDSFYIKYFAEKLDTYKVGKDQERNYLYPTDEVLSSKDFSQEFKALAATAQGNYIAFSHLPLLVKEYNQRGIDAVTQAYYQLKFGYYLKWQQSKYFKTDLLEQAQDILDKSNEDSSEEIKLIKHYIQNPSILYPDVAQAILLIMESTRSYAKIQRKLMSYIDKVSDYEVELINQINNV